MELSLSRVSLKDATKNFFRNWLFPVSAVPFFFAPSYVSASYFNGMLLALVLVALVAIYTPSIWRYTREKPLVLRLLAFAAAIGVGLGLQTTFYYGTRLISIRAYLVLLLEEFGITSLVNFNIFVLISWILCLGSLYFSYCVIVFLFDYLWTLCHETKLFQTITRAEIITYASLFVIFCAFSTVIACFSTVFLDGAYDTIYTSDSTHIETLFSLTHLQNDIRQPLFMIFAAPFTGIPYLIGRILFLPMSIQILLVNYVQIALLFSSVFLLTNILNLSPTKRICFVLLFSCTYMCLLFSIMMEQYILAVFWLLVCVYSAYKQQRTDLVSWCGACGSLVTSAAVFLIILMRTRTRSVKEILLSCVKYGFAFLAVLLFFCRFDALYYATERISKLSQYSGGTIYFSDRLLQYFAFVKNCFAWPNASAVVTEVGWSWQLCQPQEYSIVGICIFVLCIISAILNRKRTGSVFATIWLVVSVGLLIFVGWGLAENGLILYSLYFGWAFLVLLYQLVEYLEEKLHIPVLVPIICGCAASVCFAFNIPALAEIIDFAVTYHPI